MSTHTRVTIETVAYECSLNDCGHDFRPCPSTGPVDSCRECTERSAEEYEGPVVEWDECQGVGMGWHLSLDEPLDPLPAVGAGLVGALVAADAGLPVLATDQLEVAVVGALQALEEGPDELADREHGLSVQDELRRSDED